MILFLAQAPVDNTNMLLLVSSIITAVFGGIVLVITTRSNTKINEMKVTSELEKAKLDAGLKIQHIRMDAQRALSAVNAASLASLHSSVAANTAETIKSTVATDQTKQRVEELAQKMPLSSGGSELPVEVRVINEERDPVPTKPPKEQLF